MTEPLKRKNDVEQSDSASNCDLESYLVAAIENRATEIGVAILHKREAKLSLCQFIETSRSYNTTLMMLSRFPPEKLIIVTERNTVQSHGLNQATQCYKQVATSRGSFDDSRGELMIQSLSMRREIPWSNGLIKKGSYLAIGAAGALLEYFQETEHNFITPQSLQVEFISTEKHLELDIGSVECLGLIKAAKATNRNTPSSLFRIMNKTQTQCGARLLKSNLLQPFVHIETIICRYEAVEELIQNKRRMERISSALNSMPKDLDRICSVLTIQSTNQPSTIKDSVRCRKIASLVDGVMLMKEVLSALGNIAEGLESCKSVLLKGIFATLKCSAFDELAKLVDSVLDEDVHRQRSSALKRIEQCYAIKCGFDGFLDVARENFCRITEQIHSLADQFQTSHQLDDIKVTFNTKRGFSFLVSLQSGSLPKDCMVIKRKGRWNVHFVTHELIALNSRLSDATHDCMLLTQQALEGVISSIMEHLGSIRKLVDSLALLDVLLSFAELANGSSGSYTRPQINPHGLLAISKGKHPVMEVLQGVDFSPNDTFMTKFSSCHIITGPNMSGKSTYLKQVALILIMAQIGSFVPAEEMTFSPRDKIFTRLGFGDSIETNSSSFMVEMQEMNFILRNSTPHSFVIIDELGRATSTADGVSIAWAVCERLIQKNTLSLVATHFQDLAYITEMYPSAKLHFLEVKLQTTGMEFLWKLQSLTCEELQTKRPRSYGIELAKLVDFPEQIIIRARQVAESVKQKEASLGAGRAGGDPVSLDLGIKLLCLTIQAGEMTDEALSKELHVLKEEFV